MKHLKTYTAGLITVIASALLAGCITFSDEITLSNGQKGHKINCPQNIMNDQSRPEACIKKAGDICGSQGYRTIDQNYKAMIIQCGNASSYYTPQQYNTQPEKTISKHIAEGFRDLPLNEKFLLQVRNHKNCGLWESSPYKAISVTWTGQCKDGWATGEGLATFKYDFQASGQNVEMLSYASGSYQNGKAHGYWEMETNISGLKFSESSGLFHDGEFFGEWKAVLANGATITSSFRNNQMHGEVTFHTPDGDKGYLEFVDGKFQE